MDHAKHWVSLLSSLPVLNDNSGKLSFVAWINSRISHLTSKSLACPGTSPSGTSMTLAPGPDWQQQSQSPWDLGSGRILIAGAVGTLVQSRVTLPLRAPETQQSLLYSPEQQGHYVQSTRQAELLALSPPAVQIPRDSAPEQVALGERDAPGQQ